MLLKTTFLLYLKLKKSQYSLTMGTTFILFWSWASKFRLVTCLSFNAYGHYNTDNRWWFIVFDMSNYGRNNCFILRSLNIIVIKSCGNCSNFTVAMLESSLICFWMWSILQESCISDVGSWIYLFRNFIFFRITINYDFLLS